QFFLIVDMEVCISIKSGCFWLGDSLLSSFLAVLTHQPGNGTLFSQDLCAPQVADPILVRHRWQQRLRLLIEGLYGIALLGGLLNARAKGVVAIRAVRIHRVERFALDGDTDQLADQGFSRPLAISPTEIHSYLEGGLAGGFIALPLVRVGQVNDT